MPKKLLSVFDYRDTARSRLARIAFDYLERGAEDELTLQRNRQVLESITFNPRVLAGISQVDLSTTLFGRRYELPLVVAPTGFSGLFWTEGDTLLARAAAATGIPYGLSTVASATIENIAAIPGVDRWFQVYMFHDDAKTYDLIRRAADSGYTALILTVDTAVSGKREASMRHGTNVPIPLTVPFLLDVLSHPRWTYQMLRFGAPRLRNVETAEEARMKPKPFSFSGYFKPTLCWDDVARMRAVWRGPFIIKGIQTAEDARIAAQSGVDGIVLSNHGGRQLDGSPSAMEVLPEVAAAVGKSLTIMVDGGFRRGSDVIKALALGADAVMLGRAPLYGLATSGKSGVLGVLQIFREEMERTMALIGVDSLARLQPSCLRTSRSASVSACTSA